MDFVFLPVRDSFPETHRQQLLLMTMMMKVSELVLMLSCVLCVSAEDLHQDLNLIGCNIKSYGEVMYSLDGNELWFADFINERGVEPQPSFIDHITYPEGTYELSVADQQICRANLQVLLKALKDVPLELDPPHTLTVYTRDDQNHGGHNTLICHVAGFYPAPVKIYWTRNGENVTEGGSTSVPHLTADGFFSQTSRLSFSPQRGDVYGCTVEHPALDQPLTKFWGVKGPRTGPGLFWGVCLTFGLLVLVAGGCFLLLQLMSLCC